VSSPTDLRKALTRDPQQFVQTFVQKLLMYALGRPVDNADMPFVRQIVRESAKGNYRFSQVIEKIVESEPFLKKQVPTELDANKKEETKVAAR
jgi:hypothetical protein